MAEVHKINRADLAVGTQIEQAEHPTLGTRTARTIARDHIMKDPNAYKSGKKQGSCGERENIIVLNQTIKVKPQPPKKKPLPQVQAPAWQTWGHELL